MKESEVIKLLFKKTKTSPELVALRFLDYDQFWKATRVAMEKHIPIDVPGELTIIIPKTKEDYFITSFKCKPQRVVSSAELSEEDLSEFRQALYKCPKPPTR